MVDGEKRGLDRWRELQQSSHDAVTELGLAPGSLPNSRRNGAE